MIEDRRERDREAVSWCCACFRTPVVLRVKRDYRPSVSDVVMCISSIQRCMRCYASVASLFLSLLRILFFSVFIAALVTSNPASTRS